MKKILTFMMLLLGTVGNTMAQESATIVSESGTIDVNAAILSSSSVTVKCGIGNGADASYAYRSRTIGSETYGLAYQSGKYNNANVVTDSKNVPTEGGPVYTFVITSTGTLNVNFYINSSSSREVRIVKNDGSGYAVLGSYSKTDNMVTATYDVPSTGTYYVYGPGSAALELSGYTFTHATAQPSREARTWDFNSGDDAATSATYNDDIDHAVNCVWNDNPADDPSNWKVVNAEDGQYANAADLSAAQPPFNAGVLDATKGLLITATAGNLIVKQNAYIRLRNEAAKLTIPNLKSKDANGNPYYVIISTETASPSVPRGLNATSKNLSNPMLYTALGRQAFVYEVKKDGDGTFEPTGGLYIYEIQVTSKPAAPISYSESTLTFNYADRESVTLPTLTNASDPAGTIVYSSSDDDIATVDASGQVTINRFGTVTILAKRLGDDTYHTTYATYTLTITDPSVYTVPANTTYKVGDELKTGNDDIVLTMSGYISRDPVTNTSATPYTNSSGSATTDSWKKSRDESKVSKIDGYPYSTSANNNSGDELNGFVGGANHKQGANNPYRMPNRGGFLKFEPKKDGELTVIIHQNGALSYNGNSVISNQFHLRRYYFADETGDYITMKHCSTEGVVKEEWDDVVSAYETNGNTFTCESHDDNVDWQGYAAAAAVSAPRDIAVGSSLPILQIDGGYAILCEAFCQYTFDVKAGKTYYVYTNRTKLGFAGYQFVAKARTTETTVEINENNETYTVPAASDYYKVNITKKLNPNMWNAVVFPFSMTEKQVEEVFGSDMQLLDYDHNDDRTLYFKRHFYHPIVAGRPYLVWTSKETCSNPTGYVAFSTETAPKDVKTEYFGIPTPDVTPNECLYKLVGTYYRQKLPVGAYFVSGATPSTGNSQLRQNTSANRHIKGFRCYLTGSDGTAMVKPMMISFNGVSEQVTAISDVEVSGTETGDIYTVNGQKTKNGADSLDGLPKGIYLMNGKKYIVK